VKEGKKGSPEKQVPFKSMEEITAEKEKRRVSNRRVHMANERTFLAWIRTSIGIMAFGFVVEKFALFVRQISFFLGRMEQPNLKPSPPHPASPTWSSVLGILLVALGTVMGVLAFVRYKKTERQIEEDSYRPSLLMDILLALSISAVGIFLIIYLIHSL
jgi:uncharacterized membrane protein YidH (DUF202 family)